MKLHLKSVVQVRIQDLKLGVVRMDWKIWSAKGVVWIYSKYDYYSIYI